MTGCPPADALDRLLADALTAVEAAGVEAHVERCPACQAELDRRTAGPPVTPPMPVFPADPDLLRALAPAVAPAADLPAVPGYRLRRELGRGGMGVVYEAVDERLGRPVALKLLAAADAGGRFRREAAAVARVRHPDIVQIYEVGAAGGRPFLALELVDGPSLDRHLAGRPLPARPAAELVEVIARAAHAAHRAGVVHRDLKPANVLMTPDGRPKVADFGLAKLLGEAAGDSATRSGQMLGTPSYAAPEQLVGRAGGEVGPPADVYALGAVLYECLTGRPPFRAATPLDTLLQSVHHDPVSPARLRPDVPRDLATVCLHCLRKTPAARYASAADLADDLRRFLDGKPVRARPVGWAGRAVRWARRNPAAAGLVATLALAAGGGVAGLGWLWREAERRATVESRAAADADRRAAELAVDHALALCERGDVGRGVLALADAAGRLPGDDPLGWTARLNLAAWQAHLVPRRHVLPHPARVAAVAVAPAGGLVATVCDDGAARLWDAAGRRVGGDLRHPGPVTAVAFAADGAKLATAGRDGTARVWDAAGRPVGPPVAHDGPVTAVAFAPDDRLLTGSADGTARLGDTTFAAGSPVLAAAVSPDCKRVLTGSADGRARLWDAATGDRLEEPVRQPAGVRFAAFAPDGSGFAVGGPGGLGGRVPDGTRPRPIVVNHPITGLAYDPAGEHLIAGGGPNEDRRGVAVYRLGGREAVVKLLGFDGPVRAVAHGPGWAAAGGDHWRAVVWLGPFEKTAPLRLPHPAEVSAVAHGGGRLATASGSSVFLWELPADAGDGSRLGVRGASAVMAGPDFVVVGDGKTARGWAATGQPVGPAVPAGGKWAVTGGTLWAAQGTRLTPVDLRTGKPGVATTLPAAVRAVAGGADVLAVADDRPGVRLLPAGLDLVGGGPADALAVSPDGGRVAAGGPDGAVRMWVTAGGQPAGDSLSHPGAVRALAFAPGGRLAVAAGANAVQLWGPTGDRGPTLLLPELVTHLAWHPGGRLLATGCLDGTARLWDGETGKPVGPPLHWHATALAFAPDGSRLLVGSPEQPVRGWRVSAPLAGDVDALRSWASRAVGD